MNTRLYIVGAMLFLGIHCSLHATQDIGNSLAIVSQEDDFDAQVEDAFALLSDGERDELLREVSDLISRNYHNEMNALKIEHLQEQYSYFKTMKILTYVGTLTLTPVALGLLYILRRKA
ncbi:hypothetical protein FJ364_05070, partial [Candidatus Dependentiae bacterium]|nr:hypothetical protein [Candidatus Dependentiae bacterium]